MDEALALAEELDLEYQYDWSRHARPDQLAPAGDWRIWLIMAGRGWGKTRTGAEWIKKQALDNPGTRWAIVGPNYASVDRVCFEGESGLRNLMDPSTLRGGSWDKAYNSSDLELFLANGSLITGYYAEKPDNLRGPQHHGAWCDELAAWRYADTWDQLLFGLRLGDNPQVVITTTPQPNKLVKALVKEPGTHITRGSTFDNAANLATAALEQLRAKYEGTRLGRQELYAELLTDTPGALATFDQLGDSRVDYSDQLLRVIVSVDPAVTNTPDSDETGITVQGRGFDGHGYLMQDLSCRVDVDEWARRAIGAAMEWNAGMVLYERNQGHDLYKPVFQNAINQLGAKGIILKDVNASKSKFDRALSLQQYIQQGKWHLVGHEFEQLEDQLTSWTLDSKYSPDRIDSAVHGFNELFNSEPKRRGFAVV